MTACRIEPVDRDGWSRAAPAFLDYNYRQLWAFGVACAERVGAISEHVAVLDGSETIALADVRIKRIPVIGGGIAYITGGPLVRKNHPRDAERLDACLGTLVAEYVRRRSLVLRIAPALGSPDWNDQQASVFGSHGFVPTDRARPYRTLVVDIDRPVESIRKSLDQKWRNCLNRAERNSPGFRCGESADLFKDFRGLYGQLLDRKGFDVDLDAGFYAAVQHGLGDGERFLVGIADIEGRPVAGHVSSILGDTCVYLLGASSEEGLQTKASYLLQWRTIEAARGRGCRWYDLGGIDPDGNPGVYHFKHGLGGADIRAPGPYEMAPDNVLFRVTMCGERLYRWAKRVLRSRPG